MFYPKLLVLYYVARVVVAQIELNGEEQRWDKFEKCDFLPTEEKSFGIKQFNAAATVTLNFSFI